MCLHCINLDLNDSETVRSVRMIQKINLNSKFSVSLHLKVLGFFLFSSNSFVLIFLFLDRSCSFFVCLFVFSGFSAWWFNPFDFPIVLSRKVLSSTSIAFALNK